MKTVAPLDANGASEWMTIGGILTRKKYEAKTVEWVRDVRTKINATQGPALHFRNLSPTKKIAACKYIAELPVVGFCVATHKVNMKGYRNIRAERHQSQEWFYNWCLRLLFERATALVHRQSLREFGEARRLKVVLAERGGHLYGQTAAYIFKLQNQARTSTAVLQKRQIHPDVLDFKLITSADANSTAGAQLADVISSAFYTAVRRTATSGPFTEPAKHLSPIMPRENGCVSDFGLVLQPPSYKTNLHHEQREIFRHYGYVL